MSANANNSEYTLKHLRDRAERFQDEVSKLKALDYLLSSSTDDSLRELSWLISPIAISLNEIREEMMEFFYTQHTEVTTKAKSDKKAKPESVNV
ncbi:hypothetical protein A1359_13785 [Methylomonas lenta]|uniref:Uncharacterized protein n=1 Tax=Methylomonas lenta TaxID=980561 RepID=A0A177N546_9GAMM|nr:hypothetical protein [Methylomonas lenta]OAI12603.1 hypothetical protein A1359_13785 [Methylomonas lenta]